MLIFFSRENIKVGYHLRTRDDVGYPLGTKILLTDNSGVRYYLVICTEAIGLPRFYRVRESLLLYMGGSYFY